MSRRVSTAGVIMIAGGANAGPVTIDFESLDQAEIFSGTTWAGSETTDLLDVFGAIEFSSGISGVNHVNIGLPSGDGVNGLFNAIAADGDQSITPDFTMTAVNGTWSDLSFIALVSQPDEGLATAFDTDDVELGSITLGDSQLDWLAFELAYSGVARVEFTGFTGGIFIDDLSFDVQPLVIIPLPHAAGLTCAGLCVVAWRRRRPV